MRVDLSDTTYTQLFNAEKCREEKRKILEQMCIELDLDDKILLNKLTTARQMDAFVVSMVHKYW